jgi:hypothetical protein
MRRAVNWWVVGALAVSVIPAWAAEPTSPETRVEMIQLIDTLEKHPNDPDARAARGKVMTWLTDAPDVTVTVCGDLLGDASKYTRDQSGDFLIQLAFSEAKFILENPGKANDDQAVHLAGVEGMLRTYAAMKRDDPKLKITPLETLSSMQTEQTLTEHVAKAIKKCK